jgi:DNA-binding protein YbaB
VNNDAAEHEFAHVLALVQEQMQELSVMKQQQSAITATATAADGTVEVTVDAQRVVTHTVIDESYLDEFEFADLGGHVTTAAQAALEEVERRSAALLAPLTRRREEIASASGSVIDIPDFQELLSGLGSATSADTVARAGGSVAGRQEGPSYPTVRR